METQGTRQYKKNYENHSETAGTGPKVKSSGGGSICEGSGVRNIEGGNLGRGNL